MKKKTKIHILILLNLFVICLILVVDNAKVPHTAIIRYTTPQAAVVPRKVTLPDTNNLAETTDSKDFLDLDTYAVVDFPININTATKDQLMQLYRIGDVISDRIIAHRNKIGSYTDIQQLKEVQGIGEKIFQEIEGSITV